MEIPIGKKVAKHILIAERISQLGTQVSNLEYLVRQIKGDKPEEPTKDADTESTTSLAHILDTLPNEIASYGERIATVIEELRGLLF